MATQICTRCGAPLIPGARFCSRCRCPQAAQPVGMGGFCMGCGAQLIQGAAFCSRCRRPVGSAAPGAVPAQQPQQAVQPAAPGAALNSAADQMRRLGNSSPAPKTPGEFCVQIPDASGGFGTAGSTTGSLIQKAAGCIRSLGTPRALAGMFAMILLWLVAWLWNCSPLAGRASALLSALTFAEGGTRGTFTQVIGGTFGKGMVMAAFASLFSGGLGKMASGVKGLFSKGLQVPMLICGIGTAILLYQLFAGYAGTYGISAALSGAFLSLQALGGHGLPLAAGMTGTGRLRNGNRRRSLLSGLTAGFALSAVLSAVRIYWWIGLLMAVIGFILSLIFRGRGAAA